MWWLGAGWGGRSLDFRRNSCTADRGSGVHLEQPGGRGVFSRCRRERGHKRQELDGRGQRRHEARLEAIGCRSGDPMRAQAGKVLGLSEVSASALAGWSSGEAGLVRSLGAGWSGQVAELRASVPQVPGPGRRERGVVATPPL